MTEIVGFNREVGENQGEEGGHLKSAARSAWPREMEGGSPGCRYPIPKGSIRGGQEQPAWHHHRGTSKKLQFDTTQTSLHEITASFSDCFIQK